MTKLFKKTLIAAGIALSTVGVAHAHEHETHKGTQSGTQQNRDQNRDQNREHRTMGTFVDDTTITAKVKARHAEDKLVSAMRVNVETREGVVILSGEGRSEAEIKRAETLAKQVDGVKSVTNMIELKPRS